MRLKDWDELPDILRSEETLPFYTALKKKRYSLAVKRVFDIFLSLVLLLLLSPVILAVSAAVRLDSEGRVFFRQLRYTQYKKQFYIYKFRTMTENAEEKGSQLTVADDPRLTRIGSFLRKFRLDEVPQLINILKGEMTFVGTRPEVGKYIEHYSAEMNATLLLPAGLTSEASLNFKDEHELLSSGEDPDEIYINEILPEKMKYNLRYLQEFSLAHDIKLMFRTISAVFRSS